MKTKAALIGSIFSLIGALIVLQTNTVLAFAADTDNPITSAITSVINIINNTPNDNTVNENIVTNTSTTNITNPVTVPIIDPTPNPVTIAITQPIVTPASSQSSNSNSSNQPSGDNGFQAPICGDSKPVSAPKIVYASATGRNQVTLVWSSALNPVSYYLVAYGTKPGQPEYGNPNVGDKNTTRYIVNGLDNGKTYYFKIRAGNGCMPGEFSNEVAVKATGDKISGPAVGFKSGVLGSTEKETAEFKPITEVQPERITQDSISFFTKIANFFTRLFKGK